MNRKQKMIHKMWNNYKRNCKCQNQEMITNYRGFKWVYTSMSFKELYEIKSWYKDIRIKDVK